MFPISKPVGSQNVAFPAVSASRASTFGWEAHKNICESFSVNNVVLTRCLCAQPPRVYTHA